MKKGFSEIICILDRSGSMSNLQDDVVGGFNRFIDDQKKVEGTAAVSLVLFDHEYILLYSGKDLEKVEPLTSLVYVPRGTTALMDAIGRTITTVGERLAKTDESERPEKVIVSIMTDGYENASAEYTKDKITKMIKEQREKYSWEFVFTGANIDSVKTATDYGMSPLYASNFASNSRGVGKAYAGITNTVSALRTDTEPTC